MLALSATSVYERGSAMQGHSQIANVCARADFRKTHNYLPCALSHHAYVDDDTDKNGGPNYLRAWMEFRSIKGVEVAKALGGNVTPGMVSDLANSKRALSAKWLRRLAPIFDTTPGMLLDHDPRELDSDIVEIWAHASNRQRQQLADIAKTLIRTGTED